MASRIVIPLAPGQEVRVVGGSGRIRVRAGSSDGVVVRKGDAEVPDGADGPIVVRSTSGRIDLEVPRETDLLIGSGSGAVEVRGRAGRVAVTAESGSVAVEKASEVDIRSDRGGVVVGSCVGECRVVCGSGRVAIRSTGSADVMATSGRLAIEKAHGPVQAKTVSGRLVVALAAHADVVAESVAGQVVVKVPPRIRPTVILRSEWGKVAIDVPEGDDCVIAVESVRGRLSVEPA